MPEAIPPVGASWDQEAIPPVGASWDQKGAFYGQERRRYRHFDSYFYRKNPATRRGVVHHATSCKPTPRRNRSLFPNNHDQMSLHHTRRPPARRGFLDGAGFLLLLEIFF